MKQPKLIATVITDIQESLLTVYDDPTLCRQYAWWTLETITDTNKAALIAHNTINLTPAQQQTLEAWLTKMITEKMPIQYLIGSVPFNDLDILVEPPTLIPRPETEEWCLTLIEQLLPLANTKLSILDLCCGSGCIALALAKALPASCVHASDIADTALALSKKNAVHNNIINVTFIKSDLFDALPHPSTYDLIVSNPPYITPQEWQELDESVAKWEDKNALVAQHNGLELLKKIIEQAPAYIQKNDAMQQKHIPQLVVEIGYLQGQAVADLMHAAGYNNVTIHTDLEGKDRVVTARMDNIIGLQVT